MISVCIPVFNRDITGLVNELKTQSDRLSVPVEILVMDDASTDRVMAVRNETAVKELGGVWIPLQENIGRMKIRKELAEKAIYPFLLFLDNDGWPVTGDFLSTYLVALAPHRVLCGGRSYREALPAPNYQLHWKYGKEREATRISPPFLTANVCVPQTLLLNMPELYLPQQYGHEDTWMQAWLQANNTEVEFLNNPVYHDGLKPFEQFMTDQREAVENLLYIYKEDIYLSFFLQQSALLRLFSYCRKTGAVHLLSALFPRMKKNLEARLQKPDPSLRWLDLYKLLYAGYIWGKLFNASRVTVDGRGPSKDSSL